MSAGESLQATHRQMLVFEVSGQSYAVPVAEVREVVAMAELASPPNAPAVLAGFLSLGSTTVTVIRASRLFGLSDTPIGLYTPLLVMRAAEPWALQVDSVNRIVSVGEEKLMPVPENLSFNCCAVAGLRLEDRTAVVLASERMLQERERRRLADLQSIAERRMGEFETADA